MSWNIPQCAILFFSSIIARLLFSCYSQIFSLMINLFSQVRLTISCHLIYTKDVKCHISTFPVPLKSIFHRVVISIFLPLNKLNTCLNYFENDCILKTLPKKFRWHFWVDLGHFCILILKKLSTTQVPVSNNCNFGPDS